ncbi:hypothetical protein LIA77_07190 [Sarocladium implicatum]|nr:hypothetical protein LIA77_07190 [Sarocladium implicatum]
MQVYSACRAPRMRGQTPVCEPRPCRTSYCKIIGSVSVHHSGANMIDLDRYARAICCRVGGLRFGISRIA